MFNYRDMVNVLQNVLGDWGEMIIFPRSGMVNVSNYVFILNYNFSQLEASCSVSCEFRLFSSYSVSKNSLNELNEMVYRDSRHQKGKYFWKKLTVKLGKRWHCWHIHPIEVVCPNIFSYLACNRHSLVFARSGIRHVLNIVLNRRLAHWFWVFVLKFLASPRAFLVFISQSVRFS